MSVRSKLVVRSVQVLSVLALIGGVTACGSISMPENMNMTMPTWGQNTARTASTPAGQSSGVSVPASDAQPMSPSSFATLKAQVADEAMSSNKIARVEEAGRSAYFSAAQVGELTELLNMKNDRVLLVKTVVERILDLDNPAAITSKLTFADERSDVESLMSKMHAARTQEIARLAEESRQAEEARLAEENRLAEEARQRDIAEQQRREREAAVAQTTSSDSSTSTQNESTETDAGYCCINGKYNTCESAGAVAACFAWGKCYMDCFRNNGRDCQNKCVDENPMINQCYGDASKDHLCNK